MNRIGITTFAFRLAAIYVWILALLQVLHLPQFVDIPETLRRAPLISFVVPLLLQASFGTFLWLASGPLARRMFGTEQDRPLRGGAEMGGLALRLAGIWIVDRAIQGSWNLIYSLQTPLPSGDPSKLIAEIVAFAVLASAGLTLLLAGGLIAKRMFPTDDSSSSMAADLQPIAFSVLGLLILMKSLPPVLSNVINAGGWASHEEGTFLSIVDPEDPNWPIRIAAFLRVGLGLALFLGGRPLARLLRWMQTAGLDRTSRSGPPARTDAPRA